MFSVKRRPIENFFMTMFTKDFLSILGSSFWIRIVTQSSLSDFSIFYVFITKDTSKEHFKEANNDTPPCVGLPVLPAS